MVNALVDLDNTLSLIKESKNPLIIWFTASWCGPCKSIESFYLELSEAIDECDFYSVDIDEGEDISDHFNIKSVPTFIIFKDNTIVDTVKGANKEALGNAIKTLMGVPSKSSNLSTNSDVPYGKLDINEDFDTIDGYGTLNSIGNLLLDSI